MKLISTAAIPELLFVGRNAIITNDQAQSVIAYNIAKMKNKIKFICLNTPKYVIIVIKNEITKLIAKYRINQAT